MLTRVAPSCSFFFKPAFQHRIDRVFFHEIMAITRNRLGCKLSKSLGKIIRYSQILVRQAINTAEDKQKYQPIFLLVFSWPRLTKSQVYWCIIKIFLGAGVVTPSTHPPPHTNNFCLYPPPVLRCFRRDPLMTPTSSILHATPSPFTTPSPLKF